MLNNEILSKIIFIILKFFETILSTNNICLTIQHKQNKAKYPKLARTVFFKKDDKIKQTKYNIIIYHIWKFKAWLTGKAVYQRFFNSLTK